MFRVTCITHRKDPIFHGIFAGTPPCETSTLWNSRRQKHTVP
ncbi:MAG: UbiD family decarboxylase [Lautropia sp.]|nr:UbiD family decarboxylase [Lautropia sp.]